MRWARREVMGRQTVHVPIKMLYFAVGGAACGVDLLGHTMRGGVDGGGRGGGGGSIELKDGVGVAMREVKVEVCVRKSKPTCI